MKKSNTLIYNIALAFADMDGWPIVMPTLTAANNYFYAMKINIYNHFTIGKF